MAYKSIGFDPSLRAEGHMEMTGKSQAGRAIVIGGSIAGLFRWSVPPRKFETPRRRSETAARQ
jgi:hypothetical protein